MIRHKEYQVRSYDTHNVFTKPFEPEHFVEAGIPVMEYGMPRSEALELVNKWNRMQHGEKWAYWIEETV